MNGLVKNVFLLIMGVTVASVLYVLLFGSLNWQGSRIEMNESTGYSDRDEMKYWKGALWYAAEMVEIPISRYYQMYCLVPNLHVNDYVDQSLGATIKQLPSEYVSDTPARLDGADSLGVVSPTFDPTVDHWGTSIPRYDTGWK